MIELCHSVGNGYFDAHYIVYLATYVIIMYTIYYLSLLVRKKLYLSNVRSHRVTFGFLFSVH